MNRWAVYLRGRVITEVYYTKDCDAAWVRDTLVNHDGLHPGIEVRRA